MPINTHFNLIAPLYDRVAAPEDLRDLLRLLDLPPTGAAPGWLLDAGGGTGRVAAVLRPYAERLVVFDLSHQMVSRAGAKDGIHAARGRVEAMPFPDNAFDRILMVDAFHHVGDQEGTLREMARVLRPGGRVLIEEPDIRHGAVKVIAVIEALLLMGSRFREPEWVRARMEALGLRTQVEVKDAHAWMVGIKS